MSNVVLVFVSEGYFDSPNCMRELLKAICCGKPIITLLESEQKHGAMSDAMVVEKLSSLYEPYEKDGQQYANMYEFWELDKDLKDWGHVVPSFDDLQAALYDQSSGDPIEWTRIGPFQVRGSSATAAARLARTLTMTCALNRFCRM